jgi:hypothetical protein
VTQRIALIGVPGSGKSEFAAALEDFLISHDGLCKSCNTPVAIVDDYAEKASQEIDLAKGFAASWYLDLFISLKRLAAEREAAKEGNRTIITCGTIIESTQYAMANFASRMDFKLEKEKEDEAKRIQAAMMTFACLFMDTFTYDKVYFLNQVQPTDDEQDSFQELDKNTRAAFEAFNLIKIAKELVVETDDLEAATEQRIEMIKGDFLNESNSEGQDLESEGSE